MLELLDSFGVTRIGKYLEENDAALVAFMHQVVSHFNS